jgi:hypothetical protein
MNALATIAAAPVRPVPIAVPAREGVGGISLELFHKVPGWAIVHAARDNSNAPLIRCGEIVVVESDGAAGWIPVEDRLFLIEYVSQPQAEHEPVRRSRNIIKPFKDRLGRWFASSVRQGMVGNTIYVSDGPYQDPCALGAKLIGRVAGLYVPSMAAGAR